MLAEVAAEQHVANIILQDFKEEDGDDLDFEVNDDEDYNGEEVSDGDKDDDNEKEQRLGQSDGKKELPSVDAQKDGSEATMSHMFH